MKVLVTGASGILGVNLTKALTESGRDVVALHLPQNPMPTGLDIPYQDNPCDIFTTDALRRAMKDCSEVYHAAGFVSYWRGDNQRLHHIHVNGTEKVAQAALNLKVSKFVYTSSVAAIGYQNDREANECTPYNFGELNIGYMAAKRQGENRIQQFIQQGLPAVIVNPTGLIGTMAVQKVTLNLMLSLQRGLIPGVPSGGLNIVDAMDVAKGHLLAAEYGHIGERYILGGENLTHLQLMEKTANALRVPPPRRIIPKSLLYVIGMVADWIADVRQQPPANISRNRALLGCMPLYYSSDKARKHLHYQHQPIQQTLENTYQWYLQQGLLRK